MPKILPGVTVLSIVLISGIFTVSSALAGETIGPEDQQNHLVWTESIGTDGLSRNMPTIDTRAFLTRVVELQASLLQHEKELEHRAEEKELGIGDAIITAVLPGGLIYAGIRQSDCDQTKQELADLRTLIDELSRDLLAYQYATGVVVFAQLQ